MSSCSKARPPATDDFPLRETLRRASIRVLAVSDRGTRGLGGPTRADDAVGPERDFVSFVRNIGEPRDTALGGGTYGFGKGIFYLLSKSGNGSRALPLPYRPGRLRDPTHRLHAVEELRGRQSPTGDRRYTGRHWWGDTSGEVVEPLVGQEAEATAQRLGLTAVRAEETGTTVVVIDPNLDELEPAEAAGYLAETITWHLWPKMISTAGPASRHALLRHLRRSPASRARSTGDPAAQYVRRRLRDNGRPRTAPICDARSPNVIWVASGLVKRIMPPLEPTRAHPACWTSRTSSITSA